MPTESPKLKDIFLAALEIPGAAERQAYVDSACGTDAELLNCVRDMLLAHQKALTPIPEGPTQAETTPQLPVVASIPPGTIIDQRYKIIELIAEGGMGSVYRACRVSDMRMEVAIKLVKPGMTSQAIMARFNIERQALAIMKHENIAKVLDAGSTREGYPYFVMELVKGMPITRFCDENKLNVHERLELFEKVCSAVQHAHQKGIVHRDLKPSNILVGLYDEKAVPKVIDFGLAKALHQPITDDILHTKFGTFVGTWQYTAPEQAILNNLDIDTRADIYSLGVILYELLTGNPPIEKSRITHAVMEEVLRIIREEEPPKPSTKIHSSAQLPNIAALRRIPPAKLERQLQGELDWIVMKALEKDRNRRYTTANDLLMDVHSFLSGDPVRATPASNWYKVKRVLKKNKGKFIIGSLVLLTILIATITSTYGLWKAKQSENMLAQELAITKALLKWIEKDMFAGVDPIERAKMGLPLDDNLPVRKLLDNCSISISQGKFSNQPKLDMRMRNTIGNAYFAIGRYKEAEQHLKVADNLVNTYFNDSVDDQSQIKANVGNVLLGLGKYKEAREYLSQSLDFSRSKIEPEDQKSLILELRLCMLDMILEKEQSQLARIQKRLEIIRQAGLDCNDYEVVSKASVNLAELLRKSSQSAKSIQILEETLLLMNEKLIPAHPSTMAVLNNLAANYLMEGKLTLAKKHFETLLERATNVYGDDHVMVALYKNNLATALMAGNQLERAESLFEQSAKVFEQTAPKHRKTLVIKGNVAYLKLIKQKYTEADAVYSIIKPRFLEVFGEQSEATQKLIGEYAQTLAGQSMHGQALSEIDSMLEIANAVNDRQLKYVAHTLRSREIKDNWNVSYNYKSKVAEIGKRYPKLSKEIDDLISTLHKP